MEVGYGGRPLCGLCQTMVSDCLAGWSCIKKVILEMSEGVSRV